MRRLKILDCVFMWHSQSVLGWPIEGLENISINTDYIELSVVFVCSGDVSSKHAVSPLSRSTLCARWPMFTPKIRFPARSLARPVRLIVAQQGPGLAKQWPGSAAEIPRFLGHPELLRPEIGWLVWGCDTLCPNIVPDIQCWRSVLCWVTINNISLQSKLIIRVWTLECDPSPRIDTCDPTPGVLWS